MSEMEADGPEKPATYYVNTASTPLDIWYNLGIVDAPSTCYRVRQFSCTYNGLSYTIPVVDFPSPSSTPCGLAQVVQFDMIGLTSTSPADPSTYEWYLGQIGSVAGALWHRLPTTPAVSPYVLPSSYPASLLTSVSGGSINTNPTITVKDIPGLQGYPLGTTSLQFLPFVWLTTPAVTLYLQQPYPA